MGGPLHLRVFLSSPGDVAAERKAARTFVEAFPRRPWVRGRVTTEVIAWDDPEASTPLDAAVLPQESVNRYNARPSECDLTVVLLWGRLGTPLSQHMSKPDGTRYASGTEWELEDARQAKKPFWLYRRTQAPLISFDDPDLDAKREQYGRVKKFLQSFQEADGALNGAANGYADEVEFEKVFAQHFEAEVRRRLEAIEGAALEPQSDRFRVFLATTADDQRTPRMKLARQLAALPDIELFVEAPPPEERDPHTAAVANAVHKADLCVHLLGPSAGAEVDWSDSTEGVTYVSEQLRLGMEGAKSQLIVQPPGFDLQSVANPAYRALLTELSNRDVARSRLEIISASRSETFKVVREKQRRLQDEAALALDSVTGVPCKTFLDAHARDATSQRVADLCGHLKQWKIEPLTVPEVESPLHQFAEGVRQAAFLVVVFGDVARDWVDHRLEEALKLISTENLPTRMGVYVTNPAHAQARFPGFYRVLDHTRGFDQPSFERWVQQLVAP